MENLMMHLTSGIQVFGLHGENMMEICINVLFHNDLIGKLKELM
eukprot:CAMPEP_0206157798 /NCGR_PEP_ID=MMETSP1474-20131121/4234_1 /ASSEMBLY_ACC=CAM_ASM_001110 /TAXON_ID=97495 /ORGANISM="Imantonia sp., Strain RCC918" /LENGTH=43 /DNA_ID= /DNA_START= /DNA_END= /DNA_ORIENTATION=